MTKHTYLTTIAGVHMFEHGKYGDTHPVVCCFGKVNRQSTFFNTEDYDIPSMENVIAYSETWEPL